jgi:hypothetical protein
VNLPLVCDVAAKKIKEALPYIREMKGGKENQVNKPYVFCLAIVLALGGFAVGVTTVHRHRLSGLSAELGLQGAGLDQRLA